MMLLASFRMACNPRLRNSGNPKLANSRFVSFIDKVSKAIYGDALAYQHHVSLCPQFLSLFHVQQRYGLRMHRAFRLIKSHPPKLQTAWQGDLQFKENTVIDRAGNQVVHTSVGLLRSDDCPGIQRFSNPKGHHPRCFITWSIVVVFHGSVAGSQGPATLIDNPGRSITADTPHF